MCLEAFSFVADERKRRKMLEIFNKHPEIVVIVRRAALHEGKMKFELKIDPKNQY